MRRFVFIPLPASDFALLPCFWFFLFAPAIRCLPSLSPHLPFRLASVADPTLVPCHHCALNFVWLRMRWLMRRCDPLLHHSGSFGVCIFPQQLLFLLTMSEQCTQREKAISTSEFLKKSFYIFIDIFIFIYWINKYLIN